MLVRVSREPTPTADMFVTGRGIGPSWIARGVPVALFFDSTSASGYLSYGPPETSISTLGETGRIGAAPGESL